MGKGLSPLQKEILAVLEQLPSSDQAQPGDWALPRDIIDRLGMPKSGVTSASMSRALLRLCQRGLVERTTGEVANVGQSFLYLRVELPVGEQ
jgi:DNA-binding MarR family transcriptional regulator